MVAADLPVKPHPSSSGALLFCAGRGNTIEGSGWIRQKLLRASRRTESEAQIFQYSAKRILRRSVVRYFSVRSELVDHLGQQ